MCEAYAPLRDAVFSAFAPKYDKRCSEYSWQYRTMFREFFPKSRIHCSQMPHSDCDQPVGASLPLDMSAQGEKRADLPFRKSSFEECVLHRKEQYITARCEGRIPCVFQSEVVRWVAKFFRNFNTIFMHGILSAH